MTKHLNVREEQLTSVTVHKTTDYIIGLKLTYAGEEESDDIHGSCTVAVQDIPFPVNVGEKLVGI